MALLKHFFVKMLYCKSKILQLPPLCISPTFNSMNVCHVCADSNQTVDVPTGVYSVLILDKSNSIRPKKHRFMF